MYTNLTAVIYQCRHLGPYASVFYKYHHGIVNKNYFDETLESLYALLNSVTASKYTTGSFCIYG